MRRGGLDVGGCRDRCATGAPGQVRHRRGGARCPSSGCRGPVAGSGGARAGTVPSPGTCAPPCRGRRWPSGRRPLPSPRAPRTARACRCSGRGCRSPSRPPTPGRAGGLGRAGRVSCAGSTGPDPDPRHRAPDERACGTSARTSRCSPRSRSPGRGCRVGVGHPRTLEVHLLPGLALTDGHPSSRSRPEPGTTRSAWAGSGWPGRCRTRAPGAVGGSIEWDPAGAGRAAGRRRRSPALVWLAVGRSLRMVAPVETRPGGGSWPWTWAADGCWPHRRRGGRCWSAVGGCASGRPRRRAG